MSAVVARGVAVGPRAAGARIGSLRVTHALLFLAASIVSPGVRLACGTCCTDPSGPASDCRTATCFTQSSARQCCGPQAAVPRCCAPQPSDACCGAECAARPHAVIPDGERPDGGCGCRCETAPRGVPAPPAPRGEGPLPAAPPPVAGIPDAATASPLAIGAVAPAAFFVERPVRIRFGVWRD